MALVRPTLLVDALFLAASAAAFAYVAWAIHRRKVPGDAHRAHNAFVLWWAALAGLNVTSALQRVLGSLDAATLPAILALTHVALLLLVVALGCLLYYLVFLLTGWRHLDTAIAVAYALFYVFLTYSLTSAGPSGVTIDDWNVQLAYEAPIAENKPLLWTFIVLIAVPQFLGAIGYSSLAFRIEDPAQRYRVSLIAIGIGTWFASAILSSALGVADAPWWSIVGRMIGLGAAATILLAYRPPAWIQARLERTTAP